MAANFLHSTFVCFHVVFPTPINQVGFLVLALSMNCSYDQFCDGVEHSILLFLSYKVPFTDNVLNFLCFYLLSLEKATCFSCSFSIFLFILVWATALAGLDYSQILNPLAQ